MNFIKKVSLPIRLVISLSIIAISFAYTFVNNTDLLFVVYTTIIVASVNIIVVTPKMVLISLITLVQAVFIGSMVYVMQTVFNPSYSVLFAISAILLSVGTTLICYRFVKGKLWINLSIIFVTFDIFLSMSYFAAMAKIIDMQVLYAILAFVTPFIFVIVKNSLISRTIVRPILPSSNSTNTILHQRITKIFKANNIKSYTKNGLITRYVLAGERIIFLYEPASLGKSKITEKGLFFDNKDYSAFIEGFIKESVAEANSMKINKNNIMPIVILHDYKDSKILNVKIYSSSKPDLNIGAVYICSPKGLVDLIKALKSKARKKQADNTSEKYRKLFS